MHTISEILGAAVRRLPTRTAVVDGTRQLTYAEFDAQVCRLGGVLLEHGVVPGEPVPIYLPNSVDLAVAYHAAQRIGAVSMPINAMNTAREVADMLGQADARTLITTAARREVALDVRTRHTGPLALLDLGGPHDDTFDARARMDELPTSIPAVDRDLEDVATVFFSSGTTGRPKGIMQTHRSLYSTLRDMEVYNRSQAASEVFLGVLPMFNNFGATCVMLQAIFNGGSFVVHERWNAERVLEDIERYRVTYLPGTPTMLTYLLQAFDERSHDVSSLRVVVTGGAPVSTDLVTSFRERLGVEVRQIYGATEVSGHVAGEPMQGLRKPGSAGTPLGSARIAILGDGGGELPPGEVGEVTISGDTVAAGYWRDAEATAVAFGPQGWRSGDLGYLDEDGYLFIVDRMKDLIICGGFNVYPLEVEEALARHAAVASVAVVGVPDDDRGEVPVAFVVTTAGREDTLTQELYDFGRLELAAYKAPRHIVLVDELPTGPSGKVLKRELRRCFAESYEPQDPTNLKRDREQA